VIFPTQLGENPGTLFNVRSDGSNDIDDFICIVARCNEIIGEDIEISARATRGSRPE